MIKKERKIYCSVAKICLQVFRSMINKYFFLNRFIIQYDIESYNHFARISGGSSEII